MKWKIKDMLSNSNNSMYMKEGMNIEKEILLRGFYGIGNWLRQHKFESMLSQETDAMNDIYELQNLYYNLLSGKLFNGEKVCVRFIQMPRVSRWIEDKWIKIECNGNEKEYSDLYKACDWVNYTQEIIYEKLSLAESKTNPSESPLWCHLLSDYVLMLIGVRCAEDDKFQNVQLLSNLMEEEELPWEFFRGFKLSHDLLEQAEDTLEINPQELLGNSTLLELPKESCDIKGQSKEQILKDLWKYERDGGYVEFPELMVRVAQGYKESGRYDALVKLWNDLAHPILQYGLLFHIAAIPDDCMVLLEWMKGKGVDEVGLTLVRDYWFMNTVRTLEKLLQYDNNPKAPFIQEIIPVVGKTKNDYLNKLKDNSIRLLDYFPAEKLSRWAYSMQTLSDTPDSIYKKAYLTVLNSVKEALESSDDVNTFSTDTKDMSYLIYLAQNAIKENNTDRCLQIEDVLLGLIDSGKFGWFGSMNQEVLNQMRIIALLLNNNHTIEELFEMVMKRLVKYEGWNITPIDKISDKTYTCAFFLSVVLLVEQNEEKYKTLTRLAFDQANNVTMPNTAFLAPLYIAELVVTDCMEDWREWYEQMVITELEDFESVIKVLLQGKSSMSEETKKIYASRKDEEWNMVKLRHSATGNKMYWKAIENMMRDLENKQIHI